MDVRTTPSIPCFLTLNPSRILPWQTTMPPRPSLKRSLRDGYIKPAAQRQLKKLPRAVQANLIALRYL